MSKQTTNSGHGVNDTIMSAVELGQRNVETSLNSIVDASQVYFGYPSLKPIHSY